MIWAKKARVFQEETDVGELGFEAREERGERFGVVGEVVVASALVVIQFTDFAEFELIVVLVIILLLGGVLVDFRVRI